MDPIWAFIAGVVLGALVMILGYSLGVSKHDK